MEKKSGKYWIYTGIGIVVVLLIFLFVFANPLAKEIGVEKDTPLNEYLDEQNDIMEDMMEDMTVAVSGNAAVDFLEGMIPHHEAAIEMAEEYLEYGRGNKELEKLAEDIILTQTDEIKQMERLEDEIERSGETDNTTEESYLAVYNKMLVEHRQMKHGSSSYKNVEHAFAEGMIMHHQMAVDMSKAILDYTNHEEVRKLAETIITAQESEIAKMQEILESL